MKESLRASQAHVKLQVRARKICIADACPNVDCKSLTLFFAVSEEYDLSALFADISSMLIGKGIPELPVCHFLVNVFVTSRFVNFTLRLLQRLVRFFLYMYIYVTSKCNEHPRVRVKRTDLL